MKKNSGILTFFLSIFIFGFLIFKPALSQDASLLPNAVQQFFDSNGNPLSSGKVYFYQVGTSTLKDVYNSSAATTPYTNPITLNAGGKPPGGSGIYGIGLYRQLVKDKNGNTIWDAVTAPGGGGGGTPTGVGDGNAVGTVLPWSGLTAPNQYVFTYGQELVRTSYPEFYSAITLQTNVICTSSSNTLTGIADTTQIPVGAPVELALCVPPGSTVISKTSGTVTLNNPANVSLNATARFFPYGNGNGSTTFNVPDLRDMALIGRPNMGGTDRGLITSQYFGINPAGLGAVGGVQTATLSVSNLPPYTPTGAVSLSSVDTVYGNLTTGLNIQSGITNPGAYNPTNLISQMSAVFIGQPQGGTMSPFSLIQPSITFNYIIKVTPDTPMSTETVVTELGGMTGVITCGTGLTCADQTISVNSFGEATTAIKIPVKAATTANIGLFGAQTIDGVSVVAGDRVLVKDQSIASENGIYVASNSNWTRATDFNEDGEAVQGTSVSVAQGNINSNTTFKVSTVNPIVIGSTSIAFTSSINLISNDVIEYNGQNLAFAQTSLDNWWFAKAGNFTASGLDNIAIGPFAGLNLTSGTHNILFGAQTGRNITTGESNTCAGFDSCAEITTGSYNSGWGVNALRDNISGNYNNAFGVETLLKNQSDFNTAFGNAAGYNNTTGTRNAYFGAGAGHGDLNDILDSTNSYATCVGIDACGQIRSGDYVTAGGYQSQFNNVSSPNNTSFGVESLLNLTSGTGGNVAFGRGSMNNATTAFQNAMYGMNSGYNMIGASQNAGIGYSTLLGCTTCTGIVTAGYFSGQALTTATNSIIIGQQVGSTTFATGSNVILIGTDARTDTPLASTSDFLNINNLIFGTGLTGTLGVPAGKVGIKIAAPVNDLDVLGTIGATGQGSFGSLASGTTIITSSSSGALVVGRQGATSPALQIDDSASNSITGVKVTAAATGGGVGIAAQGDTNTNLRIDASGSGTITLGGTSTGGIVLTRATTMSNALTYGGVTLSNSVTGTGNMVLSAAPTFTGTANFATISASASITAGTAVNAAASSGYQLGGNTAMFADATFVNIRDNGGSFNAIQIGNSGTPSTYYENTNHIYQNRSGVTMATINGSGIDSVNGFSANGTAGITKGPCTTVTSITVKNGLVTSLSGAGC